MALHTEFYQVVLYSQSVIRCYDTRINVLELTPARKVRPYLRRFARKLQSINFRGHRLYRCFFSDLMKNMGNTGKTSFSPLSKV